MHLYGKQLAAVEVLDEQGEFLARPRRAAEKLPAVLSPQVAQRHVAKWPLGDPADVMRVGADLPAFAESALRRQRLAQQLLEPSAAPNLRAKIRLKNERLHGPTILA